MGKILCASVLVGKHQNHFLQIDFARQDDLAGHHSHGGEEVPVEEITVPGDVSILREGVPDIQIHTISPVSEPCGLSVCRLLSAGKFLPDPIPLKIQFPFNHQR